MSISVESQELDNKKTKKVKPNEFWKAVFQDQITAKSHSLNRSLSGQNSGYNLGVKNFIRRPLPDLPQVRLRQIRRAARWGKERSIFTSTFFLSTFPAKGETLFIDARKMGSMILRTRTRQKKETPAPINRGGLRKKYPGSTFPR